MRNKIKVVVEPKYSHYRYSTVEVFDTAGKPMVRADNDAPRGSEWNPMTDDEVHAKFARLALPLMSTPRIADYRARFEKLETESRVDWLLGSFNPRELA